MVLQKIGSSGVALVALAGAVVVAAASVLSSTLASTLKTVAAEVALLADDGVSLIMGGSGTPIPGEDYIDSLVDKYLEPNGYDFDPQGLFTPEGLYPFTGVKNLPLDTSVDQGTTILDKTIADQPDDGDTAVLGYSQSAVISSLEMENLADADDAPDTDDLSFVLLGDPMNPNGGLLERFADLQLPSLGVDFYGDTPAETPYETDIYTLEYDGFADFPTYPLNLLADLNAVLGIATVHGTYPNLSEDEIDDAVLLPGSATYDGDLPDGADPADVAEATDYHMISTDTLPLLAPLQAVPVIGQPIYDLLEPDMEIVVNLGYGNIDDGWDPGLASEPTEFGLLPDLDWGEVLERLGAGAEQGFNDFVDDLGSLGSDSESDADGDGGGAELPDLGDLPDVTDVVNAVSAAASDLYSVLLPTADIANALVTTLPAYDLSLVADGLEDGDLAAAVFDPLAADTGLVPLALGFEAISIANAAGDVAGEFDGLF